MSGPYYVVYCTCPEEIASQLAYKVIEAKLAACVNILPKIKSVYRWKEQVEIGSEALLLIKTSHNQYEALENALLAWHPYDCPEVIAVKLERGTESYLTWIEDSLKPT